VINGGADGIALIVKPDRLGVAAHGLWKVVRSEESIALLFCFACGHLVARRL
jgi:hypothetical protein